jgi:ABC-type antimicrobial peptide transport system permease subunit
VRLLPFDYPIRNIARRPLRSTLSALASALLAALLVATAAFVRGLESSHIATAPARTAILLSRAAEDDLLRSSISAAVPALLAADVPGILEVGGVPAVSPEIHMGTDLRLATDAAPLSAFVRGVTERAFLVHEQATIVLGRMPGPREALVGRLAAEKLGADPADLSPGSTFWIEGAEFTVSGVFAAPGTTIESEIWIWLHELQGHAKRDDLSAVFVRTKDEDGIGDVDLFAQRRLDLELVCTPASAYYRRLAAYFLPIVALAWGMAAVIAFAALASGANTMVSSVQDRVRELAALRAIGFPNSALVVALVQEALLFSAIGGLIGLAFARILLHRSSMSLAMTAFRVEPDAAAILAGFLGVLLAALLGTIPAAIRILRLPVARALKET